MVMCHLLIGSDERLTRWLTRLPPWLHSTRYGGASSGKGRPGPRQRQRGRPPRADRAFPHTGARALGSELFARGVRHPVSPVQRVPAGRAVGPPAGGRVGGGAHPDGASAAAFHF
jgi:hypothetical protein